MCGMCGMCCLPMFLRRFVSYTSNFTTKKYKTFKSAIFNLSVIHRNYIEAHFYSTSFEYHVQLHDQSP